MRRVKDWDKCVFSEIAPYVELHKITQLKLLQANLSDDLVRDLTTHMPNLKSLALSDFTGVEYFDITLLQGFTHLEELWLSTRSTETAMFRWDPEYDSFQILNHTKRIDSIVQALPNLKRLTIYLPTIEDVRLFPSLLALQEVTVLHPQEKVYPYAPLVTVLSKEELAAIMAK